MKRLSVLALSLALVLLILCGCGGASGGSTSPASPPEAGMATESTSGGYGDASGSFAESEIVEPGESTPEGKTDTRLQNAKLIYTANMEVETTAFEQADRDLNTLVEQMGGYFEESSVNNYGDGYRSGSYTVRVPSAQFKPFCEQLGKLCHVTYKSSSAENVSEAYYDTQSRLTTQQTKLNRLQALLSKADKMEDIITLESAISETELTIEQLSGTLRQYDALVDYATIYVTMSEVYKLSNTEEPVSGFSQRLGTAFTSGWRSFTGGIESLLVGLAYTWPWLLLLGAVIAAGMTIAIRRVKTRDAAKQPKTESPPKE